MTEVQNPLTRRKLNDRMTLEYTFFGDIQKYPTDGANMLKQGQIDQFGRPAFLGKALV